MRKYANNLIFVILFFLISCIKNDDFSEPVSTGFLKSNGIFIVNEGNFMAGNGSISFYSKDSARIFNDIFFNVNKRPLGDVPNSMICFNGKAFIVVNNSGKIEVVETNSMKSVATLTGLISPRYILVISDTKAYVSSLYSTKLTVINPSDNIVTGYVDLRRTSEAMLLAGQNAFISSWSGGDEIMVVNTLNDSVIDSIKVGHEPESMVIDKNGILWVLCSGSYTGNYYPELVAINTTSNKIVKRLQFDSKMMYPSSLKINMTGDTLYYIEKSIWRMSVFSDILPEKPFINASGRLFYKIGIDPADGKLYATNALDYQQRGYFLIFNRNGMPEDSVRTGIIPGYICFKEQ